MNPDFPIRPTSPAYNSSLSSSSAETPLQDDTAERTSRIAQERIPKRQRLASSGSSSSSEPASIHNIDYFAYTFLQHILLREKELNPSDICLNEKSKEIISSAITNDLGFPVVKILVNYFISYTNQAKLACELLHFAINNGVPALSSTLHYYQVRGFTDSLPTIRLYQEELSDTEKLFALQFINTPRFVCEFTNDPIAGATLARTLAIDTTIRNLAIQHREETYANSRPCTDDDLTILLDAIKSHPTFLQLSFEGTEFTEQGLSVLASFIETNNSLVSLSVVRNDKSTIASITKFVKALEFNTRLHSLGLETASPTSHSDHTTLQDDEPPIELNIEERQEALLALRSALISTLQTNNALSNLQLNCPDVPELGSILADALPHNTGLESLNLRGCNISPDGLSKLMDSLHGHPELQSLDLSQNSVSNETCISLGSLLLANLNIKYVDFSCINTSSCDDVCFEGGYAIGNTLANTSTLKLLKLQFNAIANGALLSIVNGLLVNRSIADICITSESTPTLELISRVTHSINILNAMTTVTLEEPPELYFRFDNYIWMKQNGLIDFGISI